MTSTNRQNVLFDLDTAITTRRLSRVIRMAGTQMDVASRAVARPDGVIDWSETPAVSDDECLVLLAKAVANHDPNALDEVAWLIGRLAVPVE